MFNTNRVYDYPDAEGVIIAVSTPKGLDSSCDMQNVLKVIRDTRISTPILIKSTISLEGWQRIKRVYPTHTIAFSPEFLRAASAIEDFANTENLYIGGDATDFWKDIFVTSFKGLIDIQTQFSPEELILTKYFENSFLATKVAFFNQIYDLCNATDINYNNVTNFLSLKYDTNEEITEDISFDDIIFEKYKIDYSKLRNELRIEWERKNRDKINQYQREYRLKKKISSI
jgi:UDPglucose 6-dehydrogenase